MSFEEVYGQTRKFEGGYALDPDDPGGETFRGISRRSFPEWEGWPLVDEVKKTRGRYAVVIDRTFEHDEGMRALVDKLYRENFWDPIPSGLPDRVRQKVFDAGVNIGLGTAFRYLQEALNALGSKIKVDGRIGPLPLGAVAGRSEDAVIRAFCRRQESHYRDIVKRRPSQAKFLKGWLSRAAWIPGKG